MKRKKEILLNNKITVSNRKLSFNENQVKFLVNDSNDSKLNSLN